MHDSTQDSYRTIHAIHTTDSTFNFILNCTANCIVLQHCKYTILLLCTAVPYLQYYLLLITKVLTVLFITLYMYS